MRPAGRLSVAASVAVAACALAACEPRLGAPDPRAVFGPVVPARVDLALVTDEGTIGCVIEPARAPRAGAVFVGLARGGVRWRAPRTGRVVTEPMYRGLVFHRAIAGVLVQGGCPLGDGTGHPGFRVPLEPRPDDAARLAVAGALFAATYTPPPMRADPSPPPAGHVVGSQFAIGLVSMAHLAGRTTVLGRCTDLDVLARISRRHGRPARLVEVREGRDDVAGAAPATAGATRASAPGR